MRPPSALATRLRGGADGWASYAHLWDPPADLGLTRQMGPIVRRDAVRAPPPSAQAGGAPLAWAALDRAAADEGRPRAGLARTGAAPAAEEMGVREG